MIKSFLVYIGLMLLFISCQDQKVVDDKSSYSIKYNLIEPGNDIYFIKEKNVEKEKTIYKNFEAVYYNDNNIVKIERYDEKNQLTDNFDVAAITSFEYDSNNRVKIVKYFDSFGNNWEDDVFGFWSIEYIYDEINRVRMEIYRDSNNKFLEVPRDNSGNIAKVNFISPILTYEYIGDKLKIKALDENFNLLKEVYGDKPCVPFIDCGEND